MEPNVENSQTTNKPQQFMQLLEATPAGRLPELSQVKERFLTLYRSMHGRNAESLMEVEKFHFGKLISENKELQSCTKITLYGCFLDVAVNGLSFDPDKKLCYLVPFNHNVGTRNDPKWEKRAKLMISPWGEMQLRINNGTLMHADNPVIVYEGDEFLYGQQDGKTILKHLAKMPRQSDRMVACYVKLTREDGSIDYKVMTWSEFQNLRNYSNNKVAEKLDQLYNDPGFFMAKTIKHAFKTFPKLKLAGQFSTLEEVEEEQAPVIDYGIPSVEAEPQTVVRVEEKPGAFGQTATEEPATVTVSDESGAF